VSAYAIAEFLPVSHMALLLKIDLSQQEHHAHCILTSWTTQEPLPNKIKGKEHILFHYSSNFLLFSKVQYRVSA